MGDKFIVESDGGSIKITPVRGEREIPLFGKILLALIAVLLVIFFVWSYIDYNSSPHDSYTGTMQVENNKKGENNIQVRQQNTEVTEEVKDCEAKTINAEYGNIQDVDIEIRTLKDKLHLESQIDIKQFKEYYNELLESNPEYSLCCFTPINPLKPNDFNESSPQNVAKFGIKKGDSVVLMVGTRLHDKICSYAFTENVTQDRQGFYVVDLLYSKSLVRDCNSFFLLPEQSMTELNDDCPGNVIASGSTKAS